MMETVKLDKKSLMAPYQQSFRIDDLLTRKATEQQPGHFCPPVNALQPPPLSSNRAKCGQQEKAMAPANAKGVNGQAGENGEEDSKKGIKRSYSSTSNEEDDELYRKRKKARTAFSREQVAELEKKFQEKKYLSSAERGELAEKLKLSDMQVKTWFQNRRMKYKRQSEEQELERQSPKYPYSPFMSYGGMSPFYGYVPMQYKPHDSQVVGGGVTAAGGVGGGGGSGNAVAAGGGAGGVPYTYSGSALRSPQTTSPISAAAAAAAAGMDVNFVMNSPTMLGSLPSPLSATAAGMSPRHTHHHHHHHPSAHGLATPLPRPNGTSSYFNGLLTPISPSTSYQHSYFTNEGVVGSGHTPPVQGFSDWPRAVPAPTTP